MVRYAQSYKGVSDPHIVYNVHNLGDKYAKYLTPPASLPRPLAPPVNGHWGDATWISVGEIVKDGVQMHVERCPYCFYAQVIASTQQAHRVAAGRNRHLGLHVQQGDTSISRYLQAGNTQHDDFRFVGWNGRDTVAQCNLCYMLMLKKEITSHSSTCGARRGRRS